MAFLDTALPATARWPLTSDSASTSQTRTARRTIDPLAGRLAACSQRRNTQRLRPAGGTREKSVQVPRTGGLLGSHGAGFRRAARACVVPDDCQGRLYGADWSNRRAEQPRGLSPLTSSFCGSLTQRSPPRGALARNAPLGNAPGPRREWSSLILGRALVSEVQSRTRRVGIWSADAQVARCGPRGVRALSQQDSGRGEEDGGESPSRSGTDVALAAGAMAAAVTASNFLARAPAIPAQLPPATRRRPRRQRAARPRLQRPFG